MNRLLMLILSAGAVLGGIDRIRNNKYGYGARFEEGFLLLGPSALSMAGMICLTPVLADILGRAVIPLYRMIGVDPAMFGSVLAIDMGGYQMAKELAADPRIGSYAGIVASSIFGCTVVFTIPVGMGVVRGEEWKSFARGIMYGLAAMPVGLAVGGLLAGLSPLACLRQNLPVFLPALLLLVGLHKIPEQMIKGFCAFAGGLRVLITAGLILAAVEYMCGWNPVKGMAPITDAMAVVASIGVVLLGSLPAAEFLQRILKKPFARLGRRLGMKPESMTGLLLSLVSLFPMLSLYHEMDERGRVMNAAFTVSAVSLLAAHIGFAMSTEPQMAGPMIAAKLCGGAAAAALAFGMCRNRTTPHAPA